METRAGTFIIKINGLSKLRNFINNSWFCTEKESLSDRKKREEKRNYVESETFAIGKINWIIECKKENGRFLFYLGMLEEGGSVEADYSIKIISKNPEVDDINKNKTWLRRELFESRDYKIRFYRMKDISNFLLDDTIEFHVSIVIKRVAYVGCFEVDFLKPTRLSDVVLRVKGKEIHVNRQFLSMHSEYFERLFAGRNEETVFDLPKNNWFEHIIEMCRLIYPGADLLPIRWYMVEMLEVAEIYDVQYIKNVVTELLMTEDALGDLEEENIIFTKFELADDYQLKELHTHILNSMSKEDIEQLMTEEDHGDRYRRLSADSKMSLLKRYTKLQISDMGDEEISEEVENPLDFSKPNKHSDVCLIVEDKKIYANKTYLAIHSPMFEAMFFSGFKEKNQEEVHLKEVKYEVFVDALTLIDPHAQIRVQNEKLCDLLEVADRFDFPRVRHLCEKYLMHSTEVDECEKLEMAEKYSLTNLRNLIEEDENMTDVIKMIADDVVMAMF